MCSGDNVVLKMKNDQQGGPAAQACGAPPSLGRGQPARCRALGATLEGNGTVWLCLGYEGFQKHRSRADKSCKSILFSSESLGQRANEADRDQESVFSLVNAHFSHSSLLDLKAAPCQAGWFVCCPIHLKFHVAGPHASCAIPSSWYFVASVGGAGEYTGWLRDP